MPNKSTELKRGVATSEFWLALSSKIMGAVLILVAILKTGIDPDRSLMVIGIGAVLLLGVDTVYSFARAFLKSKTMALACMVLAGLLLAAPAWAELETPAASPVAETPTAAATAKNTIASLKATIDDLVAQNKKLIAQVQAKAEKLTNTAQKATTTAAKQPAQSYPVVRDPGDALVSALAQRVNEHAVTGGLAKVAYGNAGNPYAQTPYGYMPIGQYNANAGITQAQLKTAVKEAMESEKTWWDKAPWYVRVPITIGTLAILQDLGVTLPGISN